jgi:putative transposase
VNERVKFVSRIEDGERMSDVCAEFGISRKTGYKFLNRFRQYGPVGLYDEPRVAQRIPHRLSSELAELLLTARKSHPTWGPRKLRAWLLAKNPGVLLPAPSTIGELLKRNGLVQGRRRRRSVPAPSTGRHQAAAPNEIWCADFKGEFKLGNGRYCYPLTITDAYSRFIVECEGLDDTKGGPARSVFEVAFREHGMPAAILTDNGAPFASVGLLGLSRLSVWWLRLGIRHERIEPGHPEQNGRHERMHRTLKAETTRPAAATLLQQQERFDRFVTEFNTERPHEALAQRPPRAVHETSARPFVERLAEPEYPLHDTSLLVKQSGHVKLPGGRRSPQVYLSSALAGELVGVREVDDDLVLFTFLAMDLGFLNLRNRTFSPIGPSSKDPDRKSVTDAPGL